MQERASTTFDRPDNLTKNYSISDEDEEEKAHEDHSDTDAIANDGQPYPQGLISDDSNELIIMSPPNNKEDSDSLHIESVQADEIDQSYV